MFDPSEDGCRVQLWIYQEAMENGIIRIVLHNINRTQVVVDQIPGDNSRRWVLYEKTIGKISQKFNIILEVVAGKSFNKGGLVAFDNIKLIKCFPEGDRIDSCRANEYRCTTTNLCINNSKICDISVDCANGDDEAQNCDKIPYGARCTFEHDWCGWHNEPGKAMQWTIQHGSPGNNSTGPSVDHTYKNNTGKYLHVLAMKEHIYAFASIATLRSVTFNPPPRVHGNSSSRYYNSCTIRFYLHQSNYHKSGFMLQVTELRPKENVSTELLWSYNNFKEPWVQQVVILPNITYKYYLHFDLRIGIRYVRDIAIDDLSLSPECFGLNIPAEDLNGYNYYNPYIDYPWATEPHKDFANSTYYELTTCGQTGRYGPTREQCRSAYNNTKTEVRTMEDFGMPGIQKWTAPSRGYYTFLLFGASGGKGSGGMGSSRGAMVRIVLDLKEGQHLYISVGQEGANACIKSLVHQTNSSCESVSTTKGQNMTGIKGVLHMEVNDGGGGGGGATYMFFKQNKYIPIAVASGGAGLGLGRFIDTGLQHGQEVNNKRRPVTGEMYGPKSAGAGGGWYMFQGQVAVDHELVMGQALTKGGAGGKACYNSTDGKGDGGFGGGGGGCRLGGGGGGYSGGNAWASNTMSLFSANTTNGEGGYSYFDTKIGIGNFSESVEAYHVGQGTVMIIPAIPGCGCDYHCLALDPRRSKIACICPANWKLDVDGKACIITNPPEPYPTWFVFVLIGSVLCLTIFIGVVCFLLYNRYQQRAAGILRRKMLSGADVQLNRLRVASDSMMTEYNPNYEFGGVVYTLKDLKDIPRDQLRLVKALGQGAFGEVYQGFYRQRSSDTVEMPVAVKTLPEMSTNQAEMDFLMEALIMSKFNHPNIVHFIGVCFDKHPRFIVLELLAGGDLKNFLRESRPKPERSSSLTMKDLVLIAVDVAKGCRYLEENRFIHRDIAARNCLLTTKGPGRVVKIADFGMSRDIYRSDYYRKGGKAMLPIKWMPPEAFLDGIFTNKTDVWSFGVLLWEIMSMGYMPYTGCANREVMQLVTSGGRLEPPANCPGPIYGIMTQCWHPTPEQRPTFPTILERLGYCVQDPQVMSAPLPVFNRPPSHERDATVMRPNNTDEACLQVPQATDYLVPNHTTSNTGNAVGSTSSVDKLLPENSDSWTTSFVMPHSRSTQPLLPETENTQDEAAATLADKTILNYATATDDNQNPTTTTVKQPLSVTNSNDINSNHNNNVRSEVSSLKSGVSLDPAALIKQALPNSQLKKYANVNAGDAMVTGNGVIQNGPYTGQNNYVYNNTNANKYLNESEISC
ncbi:Low-density lipoprotein receptor domain class A [Popillia japonica]|uniref:Tyrosine-protein kinase receptor n=1 Tax=Popillia japonica TaxID=7064 RepID=A0AAW1JEV7_POPJA